MAKKEQRYGMRPNQLEEDKKNQRKVSHKESEKMSD